MFISAVIVLSISVEIIKYFKVPDEYSIFTLMLFSIGAGSLLGELLHLVFISSWNSLQKKIALSQDKKNEAEKLEIDRIEKENNINKLKQEFQLRIKALSIKEKEILKKVYIECFFDSSPTIQNSLTTHFAGMSNAGKLISLGFINVVDKIDHDNLIVEITPAISEFVAQWLKEGLEKEVDEFIERLQATDISLLKILDKSTSEDERERARIKAGSVIDAFNKNYSTPCMSVTKGYPKGNIHIRVSPLYKEILEEKLNLELHEGKTMHHR